MPEIRFAVWNMWGTQKNDTRFKIHREKINRLLDFQLNEKPLDLVFFQEISNHDLVFPKKKEELRFKKDYHPVGEWCSCRTDENAMGACRGIMLYQHNKCDLKVERLFADQTHPVGAKYIIKNSQGTKILSFAGFWNIPLKSGYSYYMPAFKNFLHTVFQNDAGLPCVIAGDTNLNIDSKGAAQKGEDPETCRKEIMDTADQYGLTLIGTGEKDIFTHCQTDHRVSSFFRCDLLLASAQIAGNRQLDVYSAGERPDTLSEKLKFWDSDHLPLFFTFSYDN